mgnify:CR=1 FL=1
MVLPINIYSNMITCLRLVYFKALYLIVENLSSPLWVDADFSENQSRGLGLSRLSPRSVLQNASHFEVSTGDPHPNKFSVFVGTRIFSENEGVWPQILCLLSTKWQ